MALDSAIYLVTREIAMRSGVINSRYRVADGRFVLSNKDLSLVRLTSEEYITGLQGVERISEAESQRLIAENHFQRGLSSATVQTNFNEEQPQEQEEQEQPQDEQTEGGGDDNQGDNASEEEINPEEVGDVEDVVGDVTDGDNNENDVENNETTEE